MIHAILSTAVIPTTIVVKHKVEKVLLSTVLEKEAVDKAYHLSGKSCAGILRRASVREKILPLKFYTALNFVVENENSLLTSQIGVGESELASGKDAVGTLMASAEKKLWLGNQEAFTGNYHLLMPVYAIPGNWINRQDHNGGNSSQPFEELSPCLTRVDIHAVAYAMDAVHSNSMKSSNPYSGFREVDIARTLDTNGNPVCNQGGNVIVESHKQPMGYVVRRLTPLECERLMGFPDGYTDIKPNNKPTPIGVRYKVCGNSMAVNVMKHLGQCINSRFVACQF
jgi:site-specific DNA-cytosine methylase